MSKSQLQHVFFSCSLKTWQKCELDDKPVLILSVFDIIHLVSQFPADQSAEVDSVPSPGVSNPFPPVWSCKWDVLGNGSGPKEGKTPGEMT